MRWTRACFRGSSRVVGFRPQNLDIDASSTKNRPFRSVCVAEPAGKVDVAAEELDAFAAGAVANNSSSSRSRASKASSSNASFDFFFFWSIH